MAAKILVVDDDQALLRALAINPRARHFEVETASDGATASFAVDLATRRVVRAGTVVRLTPTEWHVLEILVRNAGKLVSQQHLLREVRGPHYEHETNYLRVYLAQLRRKLEEEPARPQHLMTEPRMGYRFEPSTTSH